jgi:hypothetical protein
MAKITEAEIAAKVVEWLKGQQWDVYQEVQVAQGGRIADIVAVFNKRIVWVIECKTSFGLKVLEQAFHWRVHYRSIAIPRPKNIYTRPWTAERVAKEFYEVGIIEVDTRDMNIQVLVEAPLKRDCHNYSKYVLDRLRPEQKTYAAAGTKGSTHWTPYKGTIDKVRNFIEENPGCTLKEIMADIIDEHHYKSTQSARGSIRIALETFENWCRVEKSTKPYTYFIAE